MAIYLQGTGMSTPVGWTALSSCAAVRAGLDGFKQSEILFDRWGEPLTTAPLQQIKNSPVTAEFLLGQVLNEVALAANISKISRANVLILSPLPGGPESRFRTSAIEGFAQRLAKEHHDVAVEIISQGAAGFGVALECAQRALLHDPEVPQFIVGLDSLLTLDIIETLEGEDRIKDSTRPRGLTPGEACGAVALSQRPGSGQHGAILSVGLGQEKGLLSTDIPNVADGYTTAVIAALEAAQLQATDISSVYIDLNGEEDKFHEWGLLWARMFDDLNVVHPADCIGEVGSATVPILVGLANMAWKKGYSGGPYAAVLAGSDNGLRTCLILGQADVR